MKSPTVAYDEIYIYGKNNIVPPAVGKTNYTKLWKTICVGSFDYCSQNFRLYFKISVFLKEYNTVFSTQIYRVTLFI